MLCVKGVWGTLKMRALFCEEFGRNLGFSVSLYGFELWYGLVIFQKVFERNC